MVISIWKLDNLSNRFFLGYHFRVYHFLTKFYAIKAGKKTEQNRHIKCQSKDNKVIKWKSKSNKRKPED